MRTEAEIVERIIKFKEDEKTLVRECPKELLYQHQIQIHMLITELEWVLNDQKIENIIISFKRRI